MFHLTRTLAALCLCPEYVSYIEAKNNGLFVWQRKSQGSVMVRLWCGYCSLRSLRFTGCERVENRIETGRIMYSLGRKAVRSWLKSE